MKQPQEKKSQEIIENKETHFDKEYYLKVYTDVKAAGINPLEHFLATGWKEGRNPNKYFNTAYYLFSYSDVVSMEVNPFVHYVIYGKGEGRSYNDTEFNDEKQFDFSKNNDLLKKAEKTFDLTYYTGLYTDITAAGVDPWKHYLVDGWKEGRNPNEWFDTDFYLKTYPDVLKAGCNPFLHYLRFGKYQGKVPAQPWQISRKPILNINNAELNIGIFSNIYQYKGSETVKQLLNVFEKNKKGRITLFCSVDDSVDIHSDHFTIVRIPKNINIAEAIEEAGINIVFDPSVWPNHSRHITNNIVTLELPIAAFDISPVAEKLKTYDKGLLIKPDEQVSVINEMLEAHKEKHLQLRISQQIKMLQESEYYDRNFYLAINLDVKAAKIDPDYHFLLFGCWENRRPSLKFDQAFYMSKYQDVKRSKINPLIHFIEIGKKESRSPMVSDNYDFYRENVKIDEKQKIAVIIHAYYEDLIDELLDYSKNIPIKYDVLLSVVSDEGMKVAKAWEKNNKNINLIIKKVPNRGRDIAPAFIFFKDEIPKYDLICKIHSKKSLYSGNEQVMWRRQIIDNLLGSKKNVISIIDMFQTDAKVGLVYPITSLLPYWVHTWLSNRGIAPEIQNKLKIEMPLSGYIDYPIGSMFWFRPKALKQLTDGILTIEDFKEEPCGNDGTFAHGLERAFAYIGKTNGYTYIELNFNDSIYRKGHGSRNLHHYSKRTPDDLLQIVENKKIISFDIFDTLISRPLVSPDDLFTILEIQLDKKYNCKTNFLKIRKQAEHLARVNLKREVGYSDIYDSMLQNKLLKKEIIEAAKEGEFAFELAVSSPREKMIEIFNEIIAKKKRVLLTSDMYMEKKQVEKLLKKNGIKDYSHLYLSSEVLKRKDNGLMWNHLEEKEKITTDNFLHIGDNEHSDIQLVGDRRLDHYHVMSPLNMFANSTLGIEYEKKYPDWKQHYFLGPIINKLYNDPFIQRYTTRLDPALKTAEDTGYCIFGPIMLSFLLWLCEESEKTGIDTLYFLAREGYLLKDMYDFFIKIDGVKKRFKKLPQSKYLLTSRRSAMGAIDKEPEYMREIIANNYFNGNIRDLLFVRMGIDFNEIEPSFAQEYVTMPNDADKVLKLIQPYTDKIRSHSLREKEAMFSYLDKAHYTDAKNKIALVDVGYSGTIQRYLHRITKKNVVGYYFATMQSTRKWTTEQNKTIGYFEDCAADGPHCSILRYQQFFEIWLTSPDGQLSHFEKKGTDVMPVYKEKGDLKKLFHTNQSITDGVKKYLADANMICSGDLELLNITRENAQAVLEYYGKLNLWDNEIRQIAFLEDTFCGNQNEIDVITFATQM